MTGAGNLFEGAARAMPEEVFETLASWGGVRIERIVSAGQASAPGFWYDQDEDEFVVLLAGEAGVLLAGEAAARVLRPGDWLHLPARCRHRVEWTRASPPTLWLAVYGTSQGAATGE